MKNPESYINFLRNGSGNSHKNLLVTMATPNYIDQAKQLFASVLISMDWEGDFLLISCGIAKKDLKWFEEKGILVKEFPDVSTLLPGVHKSAIWNKINIFLPEFKAWKNIVYLDSDIIVRTSLNPMLSYSRLTAGDNYELYSHFKPEAAD